jgi:predicted methyltransferase
MGDYASDVFAAMYDVLKPGGVLGIIDHRGPPYRADDPEAATGYLEESDVIDLAVAAGFVLDASSEINANPTDPKNHPSGVWSLPPSLREGPVDLEYYMQIGESDRMTLRFVKAVEKEE